MNVEITPKKLCGKVCAVSSKSYAHRALIAAAVSESPCDIILNCFSEDISATQNCINALGAVCEYNEEKGMIRVNPIKSKIKSCTLDAGESGSTARFMLPVAAALCDEVKITGRGRLPERPLTPLLREMKKNGVIANSEKLPLATKGFLKSGSYFIEGNISSQYITGLLLALSLLDEKSEIKLLSPLESKGYINITLDVLKDFGGKIEETKDGYIVYPSNFKAPKQYVVEGDWSNSAFFVVANAIGSKIEIGGLNLKSKQGDEKIAEIVKMFSEDGDKKIDASDIPDLVPVLAVLALKNKGKTKIYNAQRLRLKESDRIKTTVSALSAFGGRLEETEDGIEIYGTGNIKGGRAKGYNDHRIVMALAIASTIAEEKCIIEGAEAVKKSYPKFFEDFGELGGEINVV